MSKYISINKQLEAFLDKEVNKDEKGQREETYGDQITRLLNIKGAN